MENLLVKFNHSQASSSTNVNPSHLKDDLNLDSLESDPGKRVPIAHYNPRIKDELRKHYIQKGPCQPHMDSYPPTEIRKRMHQFCKSHDESESSTNQGFFLGFLRWHGDKHRDVGKVILENDPQNDTLTCPMIEKDIDNACAKETLKVIIEDLNEITLVY
ncbi:hypothetical protein H5410_022215 [Solanum commersonii]|uniref:DUF4371 domain-containing protein n=1 Tax=Solanum commersonii TaxID=4109 RepID=A0A9J5ZIZ3_SOLCO|nr:hypothetical protein H5410_022215 [Solanum commersonii]